MTFLCLECGAYIQPELFVEFVFQGNARERFEEKKGIYPNESVLGYCKNCFENMNVKHKENARKKYGFVKEGKVMEEKEVPMSASERRGRLLFKAMNLLERLIAQIEKMPEDKK